MGLEEVRPAESEASGRQAVKHSQQQHTYGVWGEGGGVWVLCALARFTLLRWCCEVLSVAVPVPLCTSCRTQTSTADGPFTRRLNRPGLE